jgi:hypothetical protein
MWRKVRGVAASRAVPAAGDYEVCCPGTSSRSPQRRIRPYACAAGRRSISPQKGIGAPAALRSRGSGTGSTRYCATEGVPGDAVNANLARHVVLLPSRRSWRSGGAEGTTSSATPRSLRVRPGTGGGNLGRVSERPSTGFDPQAVALAAGNPERLGAKVVAEGTSGCAVRSVRPTRCVLPAAHEDCGSIGICHWRPSVTSSETLDLSREARFVERHEARTRRPRAWSPFSPQ